MLCVVDAIANNIAKKSNVVYASKLALKDSNYIVGVVNDIIFILSALIKEVILVSKPSDIVEFIFTDDEENWYFKINSVNVKELSKTNLYNNNKIISNISKLKMDISDNDIVLIFKK